jgi:hypothetical protein
LKVRKGSWQLIFGNEFDVLLKDYQLILGFEDDISDKARLEPKRKLAQEPDYIRLDICDIAISGCHVREHNEKKGTVWTWDRYARLARIEYLNHILLNIVGLRQL